MTQRKINFPKLAETEFQRLCDLRDVVRNKAYDDQTGWDYLLEIPRTLLAGVAHDRQVGNATARVQVKSKRTGPASTRLKLTNALHFAREPDVCFIVLFQYQDGGSSYRAFARHFDKVLIETTLRMAREADRDGRDDLNRIFVPINFVEAEDHTDDLIEWISTVCDQSPQSYAVEKQLWERRLGYETVAATTTFTFDRGQLQAFINSSVGLTGAVPVKHAVVQDVRFGIPGRHPIFEGPGSVIDICVNPQPAELIVEGANDQQVVFQGDFRMGLPVADREMMRATFIAPCLQIVVRGLEDFDLNFSFQPDEQYTIAHIDNICRFQQATRTGARISLEVYGTRVLTMACSPQNVPNNQRLDAIGLVAATLLKTSQASSFVNISMEQIHKSWKEAVCFTEMLSDGDMTITCNLHRLENEVWQIKNYLGYATVHIGAFIFWAVFRRPCLGQETMEGPAKLVFGDPVVLDGGVEPASGEIAQQFLDQRVMGWTQRLGNGTITLNEGNLRPAEPDDHIRMLVN